VKIKFNCQLHYRGHTRNDQNDDRADFT